jgi:hypothetical protein
MSTTSSSLKTPVRPRALLLGVLLGLAVCAATPYNNLYLRATLLGGGHFPLGPFFVLAWLVVLTAVPARVFKIRPFFTGLELLVVWFLMAVVSGIPYTGLLRTFFTNLSMPFTGANVSNRWEETLQPILPDWLFPSAETVEHMWYGLDGGITMSTWEIVQAIPWMRWAVPLGCWAVFILASYWSLICIANIFSRQWVVNERINFPLLRLPQVMTRAMDQQELKEFFFNRFLFTGLFISVALHTLNGLAFYYPEVPSITTFVPLGGYFPPGGIFAGFYKLRIYIFPAFIGFAFLASRQISLSMWVFYLLGSLLVGLLMSMGFNIPPSALGATFGPTLTRPEETQMIGAYLIFFIFLIWLARRHLFDVAKASLGMKSMDSDQEWFSLRASFWGLAVGLAILTAWFVFFGVGLLPTLVILFFFFMTMLVASRIITQGGIAYFTLTTAPLDSVLAIFGSKIFAPVGLALAAISQKALFVDVRESLLPALFHGAKVGEDVRNKRYVFWAMLAVILLGIVVSFVFFLALVYKFGLWELELEWAAYTTEDVYTNIVRLAETPQDPMPWVVSFAVAGGVVMSGLILCYHRFPWWPLHPIGYLAMYSSAMRILWFSFLIGWICNQVSLRYGGVATYRKVRFIFFGLILGDFLMGGIWTLVGMDVGYSYQVLPD